MKLNWLLMALLLPDSGRLVVKLTATPQYVDLGTMP